MRGNIEGLSLQNAELREQMQQLKEQMRVMEQCLAAQFDGRRGSGSGSGSGSAAAAVETMSTQTDAAADDDAQRTAEYWQSQLSAVSEWLKTGAALLREAPPPVGGEGGGAADVAAAGQIAGARAGPDSSES